MLYEVITDWVPLRIDYVYASSDFQVVGSDVLDAGCSDHRAVVSRLNLEPPR